MDKLILENVRCFQGHHELPLAPLTLLIGENSTGKSTVLAAARVAAEIIQNPSRTPDFNEEPFDWGAYDQIACTWAGRYGQAKTFTIGCEFQNVPGHKDKGVRSSATYEEKDTQPVLSEWHFDWASRFSDIDVPLQLGSKAQTGSCYPVISTSLKLTNKQTKEAHQILSIFEKLSKRNYPYAFAPIRTRPRRTYDRRADTPNPEGEHVPMVLARLKTSSPKKWTELKTALTEFGRECGLFKSVNIKSYDKKSGPFQVQITVNGSPTNLIDVGYGVSQILPLLVDCLEERNRLLLIQQPEVHLHPRAQAQLGSFFGYLVRKHQKRFIVETHSDYLVDRIRMDVRDGKYGLRPEDVQILYFERKDASVSVYPMQIDESGNLLDAPPSYRRFFLDEEERFLGG
jgi:hypothetical protein